MVKIIYGLILLASILIGVLFLAFMAEKIAHPTENAEQIARRLKENIIKIFRVFFSKEEQRHVFDIVLFEDMNIIIEPYRNQGFENAWQINMKKSVPCYSFYFVPRENYEAEKLQEITDLLTLKFRDYLALNNLSFPTFSAYRKMQGRIWVGIFYAELKMDYAPYRQLYQRKIRAETPKDHGLLRDEKLEDEIKNGR